MELIDRYLTEILNSADFSHASEILSPDFVFYGPSNPNGLDQAGFEQFIKETRAAFSNKEFFELDRVVSGDRAALRFRMVGKQDGVFYGLPPTGAVIDTEGCDFIYIRDNRICEVRAYFDLMATIQKLLVPIPAKMIEGLIGSLFSHARKS